MAAGYHVFGPCFAQVGTGAGGAFETLGITLDGGRVRIEPKHNPLMSDAAGGQVPADLQTMGAEAYIDFTLSSWDWAILEKIKYRSEGATSQAAAGPPGRLLGTGGHVFGLYLPSSQDLPWYFPTCILRNPHEVNAGSEYSKQRLSFYAWRFVAGAETTVAGKLLYYRTAP